MKNQLQEKAFLRMMDIEALKDKLLGAILRS